jgi:hypothetical protein
VFRAADQDNIGPCQRQMTPDHAANGARPVDNETPDLNVAQLLHPLLQVWNSDILAWRREGGQSMANPFHLPAGSSVL